MIIAENIDFIKQCPSLKYLEIVPADTAPENFDYSALYELPEIKYLSCRTTYGGCRGPISTTIDYSRINGLVELNVLEKGHQNYNRVESLECLFISDDKEISNLKNISCSANLKQLRLIQCKLKSLEGINQFTNLRRLSLDYDRTLSDVSQFTGVAPSLHSLYIGNCPKIRDFSCLEELVNLEHLKLRGSNKLLNLNFLKKMNKLKTFFL